MIALDTSALVAIIFLETEAELFDRCIAGQTTVIGGPTLLESYQVVRRRALDMKLDPIDRFLLRPTVRVIAFGCEHFRLAAEACEKFGRGRGHSAQLNFGDCMAYAIAKHENVPLLYKGSNFRQTGIASALP